MHDQTPTTLTRIPYTGLTGIELQLLHALCKDVRNKNIARALGKSEHTIRNQLSRLYKKVNVSSRAQAIAWYNDHIDQQGKPRRNIMGRE